MPKLLVNAQGHGSVGEGRNDYPFGERFCTVRTVLVMVAILCFKY